MVKPKDIPRLAEQMLRDYDIHTPGTLFADGLRLSINDAYLLQTRVAELRARRGEQIAGYKIGCVCAINQQSNGLSHPVYGRLWASEEHRDAVTLARNTFANLAIEGEIAVSLRHDIEPENASLKHITDAVDQVFTVIELHNLVFRGDHPRGAELIANNAIHAGVVYSRGVPPPQAPTDIDLSVVLDGHVAEHWLNRRWPDDVLMALPWLVAELAKKGHQLKAGHRVLTGAWGPPLTLDRTYSVDNPETPIGWGQPRGGKTSPWHHVVEHLNVASPLFGNVTASIS